MSKKRKRIPGAPYPQQPPLELFTFQDSTHTHVSIRQKIGDRIVTLAEGSAHKDNEDEFDPTVGLYLATGRALETLAKKFLKQGNGLVKHHDDLREMQRVQAYRKHRQEIKKSTTRFFDIPKVTSIHKDAPWLRGSILDSDL